MKFFKFALGVFVLSSVSAAVAQPQIPRPGTREYREWEMRRQGQMKAEAWNVTGKIHSFNQRAAEINVVSDDGRNWRVKLNKDAPVLVKGEGNIETLRPRSAVRFYAQVTKRGIVTEPVERVTIFTPRPPFTPMLEPTTEEDALAALAEKEAGEKEAEPAADPNEEPLPLQDRIDEAADAPTRGKRVRNEDSESDAEAEWYHVIGILMSAKKGKFVVDAGEGGKLRGTFADDAKVEADLVGIQFASPGDLIQAKGQTYPAQEMTAVATSVDVTLTPPPEEEEGKSRRATRGRARRGEVAEQPIFGAAPDKP